MTRYLLLGVAMVTLTSLAHASSGSIRFSGRIVDPGCNTSLAVAQQQLRLEGCPLAALGAEVSVSTMEMDSSAPGNSVLTTRALSKSTLHSDARVFSQQYRLDTLQQPTSASSYLVVINYP